MASLNSVQLIGNLCADPELRSTQGGQPVCSFRLAMNETWKDKSGQKQERTEFIGIVAWGKTGELCAEYLAKGRQTFVSGRLQTREWEKDGVKRYTTEVVADKVVFLGSKEGGGEKRSGGRDDFGPPPPGFEDEGRGSGRSQASGGPSEDDIPF